MGSDGVPGCGLPFSYDPAEAVFNSMQESPGRSFRHKTGLGIVRFYSAVGRGASQIFG